jgi:hypothetical protein
MIVYLWDAPPRCGVSCSLEKAKEAAGITLIFGHAPTARVESARLSLSGALESAYARTGQVWQAVRSEDGMVMWEPCAVGLGRPHGRHGLARHPIGQVGHAVALDDDRSF